MYNNVLLLFEKQENTKSKNPENVKIKNGTKMLLSKCAMCSSKKSKFTKKQEARRL